MLRQFLEYCPKEKRVTKFSKLAAGGKSTCPLPSAFLTKKHPTSGLVFPKKGTIIFYDIENIFSLEKSRVVQVWPLTHFFLFPFCENSLICLEGKSIASSGKHYSLPFLLATPSSLSRTLEGLFELTRRPGHRQ